MARDEQRVEYLIHLAPGPGDEQTTGMTQHCVRCRADLWSPTAWFRSTPWPPATRVGIRTVNGQPSRIPYEAGPELEDDEQDCTKPGPADSAGPDRQHTSGPA